MTEIQKQKEKLKKQTAEEIGNQAIEKMRKTKKRKIKSGLDKGEPSNEGKKSRQNCSHACNRIPASCNDCSPGSWNGIYKVTYKCEQKYKVIHTLH